MPRFSEPEPLGADHVVEGFDCGQTSLNIWLLRYARQAAAVGSARTYVVLDTDQGRVVGYHALAAAALERDAATARIIKGMPQYSRRPSSPSSGLTGSSRDAIPGMNRFPQSA